MGVIVHVPQPAIVSRRRSFVTAIVVLGMVVGLASSLAAQDANDGATLFRLHCAACHGGDATGNGPMARTLRHNPADLTRLAQRNGGAFPAARVRRIVEGRDVDSHGDRDMPVWGDVFRRRGDERSEDRAAARIRAIVTYLETIQHRAAD
jgi:mono/diheme cytochrome c family protein